MDSLIFENPELNNDSLSQLTPQAEQQDAIDFSNMIVALLQDISDDIEEVDLEDLKTVYREAEETYPKESSFDINLWAIGRVNMFVRLKTEGLTGRDEPETQSSGAFLLTEMTELELEAPSLREELEYIDATQHWSPSDEDFDLAGQYVQKYDLKFTFSSLSDLYIEQYKPLELEIE